MKEIKRLGEILPQLKEGMSYGEIATYWGRSRGTVQRWVDTLRKNGHDIPKRKAGIKKMEI
jgi:transposase